MRIYLRYGHQYGRDQAAQSRMGPKCGRDRASLPFGESGSECLVLRVFAFSRKSGPIASSESYCGGNAPNFAQLQSKYGFVSGFRATYACIIDAIQKNICFLHRSCHRRAALLPHSAEIPECRRSGFLKTGRALIVPPRPVEMDRSPVDFFYRSAIWGKPFPNAQQTDGHRAMPYAIN
jgi:hypothetical protein